MIAFAKSSNALSLEVIDSLTREDIKSTSVALQETLRALPERRVVYRGDWQGREVIVKRYLCYSRQQRDFQREWKHLKKLYALGIQVAKPFFAGRDKQGSLCVVMSAIRPAIDLQTLLFYEPHEPTLRALIFYKLMTFLAQQHEEGVYQSDNHLGNLLWDGKALYAVDASSFFFEAAPLSLGKRVENLAWLFIVGKLCWEDELEAVLPAYLETLNDVALEKQLREKLLSRIPQLRKKRLLKYLKKTNRSCSAFEKKRYRDRMVLCDRDLPCALQELLYEHPDQLIAEGAIIKNGNACTVALFRFQEREYIIKRYNPKSFLYRLRHCLFLSRARRSWRCGLALRLLGLPSPRPYACVEEKGSLFIKKAFVVFERVHGERLDIFVAEHKNSPEKLHAVADQLKTLWQSMDKVKAIHGDMKASNFLVSDDGLLLMIDFDHFQFFVPNCFYQKKRQKEWRRFMKNWADNPALTALFE